MLLVRVTVASIDKDTTVKGTYAAGKISSEVTITPTYASGYKFLGWFEGETPIDNLKDYPISKTTTITAKFEEEDPVYTLTLDGVVKAWFKSGKWYNDSDCKNEISDNKITPPTSSWTVTLNAGEGTLASGTEESNKVDRIFKGYYTVKTDGEQKIDGEGTLPASISESTTLFAQWTEPTFAKPTNPTIGADTNKEFKKWVIEESATAESEDAFASGDITVDKNITLTAYYGNATKSFTIVTSSGETPYYYNGTNWYDNKECIGNSINEIGVPTSPKDSEHTVTFDFNDGGNTPEQTKKAKQVFRGYVETAKGEILIPDTGSLSGKGYELANKKLIEDWTAAKISESDTPQLPSYAGHTFKFWKLSTSVTDVEYTWDTEITGNITLKAVWTDNVYTLTLDGVDKAWYKASKWYSESSCTADKEIHEVSAPSEISKTLTATLSAGDQGAAFEDGYTTSLTATSNFEGYGPADGGALIKYENEKCTLPSDGIENNTEYSEKWSTPHYTKPETDPKDKNNAMDFDGKWLDKDGVEYKFAEVEAENGITLTASWISKNVLTISETEKYYYKDSKWYSNADYTGEVATKVNTVSAKEINVTIDVQSGTVKEGQTEASQYLTANAVSLAFTQYVKKGTTDKVIGDDLALPSAGIEASIEVEPKYEEKTLKLPELTRTNFTFGGYKLGGEGGIITAGTDIAIKADTSEGKYVAQWADNVYTLTLDGVDKAWYKAGAWYSNSECSTELSGNKIADLPSAKSYDITLELDGGTLTGVTSPAKTTDGEFLGYFEKDSDGKPTGTAVIDKDGSVAELKLSGNRDLVAKFNDATYANPGTPTATNKTFSKWVEVKSEGETDVTFPLTVTGPITLKAIYEWNVAKVTIGETPYYYKENAWYKELECQTKVTEVEGYQVTKEITATLKSGTEEFSEGYSAKLTAEITFNGYKNGEDTILSSNGDLSGVNGYTHDGKTFTEDWTGVTFTTPSNPTCKNDAMEFDKWVDKDGNEYKFNVEEKTDIELTATWKDKPTYTLTLDGNGGNGGVSAVYYKGRTWYSDRDCNNKITDNILTSLPTSSWTVTLNQGEGTLASGTESSNELPRIFNGYFTQQIGGDKKIDETGKILYESGISDNTTTLYAQWTEPTFSKPANPTSVETNKEFKKWVIGESATAESEDAFKDEVSEITVSGNITLKAIYDWEVATVTIGGTPYYYKENAWYDDPKCEEEHKVEKVSNIPSSIELPEITATLDPGEKEAFRDGTETTIKAMKFFNGYGKEEGQAPTILSGGSLSDIKGYDYKDDSLVELWLDKVFVVPYNVYSQSGKKVIGWKLNGEPVRASLIPAVNGITLVAFLWSNG